VEDEMKTQSGIHRVLAAAFLAGSFAFGTAWAGAMDGAPALELTGSDDSVSGSVTTTVAAGAPVVLSFWANPTDVVTVDIDTNGNGLDTIASFHSPEPLYQVILVQDDSFIFPFDEGSTSPLDPLLQNMVPTVSGLHYVAVTVAPERVADGGIFVGGGAGSGTVTLNVTCVRASTDPAAPPACAEIPTTPAPTETPTEPTSEESSEPTTPPATEVKYVNIDVRPGSRALVRLNPDWKAIIPVAILSARGFNVRDVDVSTLTFGRTGDEDSMRNCNKYLTRANRDRRRDLVCYFENAKAAFQLGDEQGILKGELKDGTPIEGRAILKVLPEKRHWGHRHGKGHEKHADNDRRRHRGHRR
jgi:hypothetical protein